jgi:AraC-like DNA-binding protein
MFYKSYKASFLLQDHVYEYVIIHNFYSKENLGQDKFIPRLGEGLFFHFKGQPQIMEQGIVFNLPSIFVLGQQIETKWIAPAIESDMLMVRFKPTILYQLFHISSIGFNDPVDATLVFGNEITQLYGQMSEVKNVDERIPLIETFLINKLVRQSVNYTNELVKCTIDKILEHKGCIKICQLSDLFSVEERTLRRYFHNQVGVTAKSFSRMVKFNNIISEFINNPDTEMVDIVARFDYFDQTHFINDFKNIYKETPATFFRRDKQNLRILSAIQ